MVWVLSPHSGNDYIETTMYSLFGLSFLNVAISACLGDFIEFNY